MKDFLINTKNIINHKTFLIHLIFFISLYFSNLEIGVYVITFFCAIYTLLCPLKKYIDKTAIWLLVFSTTFSSLLVLTNQVSSGFLVLLTLWAPITFYCYGQYVVEQYKADKIIYLFLLFTIITFTFVAYKSILQDIQSNGFINISRNISITGKEEGVLSATLFGLITAPGLVGISMFLLNRKNILSLSSILFLLVGILSLLTTFQLVNRTGIVVAILSYLIVNLYSSGGNFFKLIFGLLIAIAVIYILIDLNIISNDIFAAYQLRLDVESTTLADGGGRFHRWTDACSKLFIYPFGWSTNHFTYSEYVHNFWLDIARQTGLIPFISFIIATIQAIKILFKLCRFQKNNQLIALLVGINACCLIAASVEPVMEGCPYLCYYISFIWGIQSQLYKGNQSSMQKF